MPSLIKATVAAMAAMTHAVIIGTPPFPLERSPSLPPRLARGTSAGTIFPHLPHLAWHLLPTGSEQQFRGLAPVSDAIAWASGTNGTVLRTTDGGRTWTSVGPVLDPDPADLQFRDIQAWSADRAVMLSIGAGALSRIYHTRDGGATWALAFANADEAAFYNCMDFEDGDDDEAHGLAVSDPVDGTFRLIETRDGGASWAPVDPSAAGASLPAARDGEFGFAASGTCIATQSGRWYVATGGVDPGRVFRSASRSGHQWEEVAANSSIRGGASAGVFSVQFRDARHGIAVGGDFEDPSGAVDNAAWSDDGGATWTKAERFPAGYRSGSAWVPGLGGVALAVGPTGSDFTVDGGRTWHAFYNGSFDSVACVQGPVCWASGSQGRIGRLTFE
ncbi:hypothetical protein SLS62_000514 [Diatrype stigma]|uniref:Oxidoreductase n=1 Tax=Diatrype stigma TaxID=117547 RepID=A0AAN9VAD3_9PEZI